MKYNKKDFWTKIQKGTKVSFTHRGSSIGTPEEHKMFFDEIREFHDYGMDSVYLCFQDSVADLGNRAKTRPVLIEDITVHDIDGEPVKEGKRVRSPLPKTPNPVKVEKREKPEKKVIEHEPHTKKGHDYGFEITEKDGRFFCPCGSSFKRKDTAIWCHRKKHLKKS